MIMAKVQKVQKKAGGSETASGKTAKKVTRTGASSKASVGEQKIANVTSEAVEKATGNGWNHWLAVLDKAKATEMSHNNIAILLHEKHGVPEWWAQTVTVGYEQARGMREKGQKADGFSISASKTINVSAEQAFEAWTDERIRARWLPDASLTIRKATPPKSVRITWEPEGKSAAAASNVEVWLTAKGDAKCALSVQHGKLTTAAAGEKLKMWWGERLEALKGALEGQ
jgi:uncharacterized protein YndB with AHSA1/START domain